MTTLLDVPGDIIREIAFCLSPSDFRSFRLTCSRIREFVNKEFYIKYIDEKTTVITEVDFNNKKIKLNGEKILLYGDEYCFLDTKGNKIWYKPLNTESDDKSVDYRNIFNHSASVFNITQEDECLWCSCKDEGCFKFLNNIYYVVYYDENADPFALGIVHRIKRPAIISADKNREEWYENGLRHREYEPAIISNVKSSYIIKEWFFRGKRHRMNGPAIIDYDTRFWFRMGQFIYAEQDIVLHDIPFYQPKYARLSLSGLNTNIFIYENVKDGAHLKMNN